jgi:integrase
MPERSACTTGVTGAAGREPIGALRTTAAAMTATETRATPLLKATRPFLDTTTPRSYVGATAFRPRLHIDIRGDADLNAAKPKVRRTLTVAQRRHIFEAAAERAGLGRVRPYDLRHSFVPLLIAEGRSIVEVARQAAAPRRWRSTPSATSSTSSTVRSALSEQAIRKARAEARAILQTV